MLMKNFAWSKYRWADVVKVRSSVGPILSQKTMQNNTLLRNDFSMGGRHQVYLSYQWRRYGRWIIRHLPHLLQEKAKYNEVIKWKHFPHYWPFVRTIHLSPANSPHKSQWRGALMFSLICALNKRLNKKSRGWWLETPLRSLWRHCNVKRGVNETMWQW